MNRVAILVAAAGLGALMVGCSAILPPALWPKAAVPSTAPSGSTGAAVSFKTEVTPILKTHCASCHSTGGPGAGKVEMFDASGEALHGNISPKIASMVNAIKTGRMPLGAPNSVPSADVAKLESWGAAGAPNN